MAGAASQRGDAPGASSQACEEACANHLFAEDIPAAASGSVELVELRVKRLPAGQDAGVADKAFSGSVSVYLTAILPFRLIKGLRKFVESLNL